MRNSDEPAYPVAELYVYNGLTKREAFAMAAMQGLYAGEQFSASEREHAAYWAVEIADALLAELAKEPK